MSEVQSPEEFQHFHRDGIKDLDLQQAALAEARARYNLLGLDEGLQSTVKNVRHKLAEGSDKGPEAVFRLAMASLKEVDRQRWVIENALEAMKHGGKIAETLARYRNLGLIGDISTAASAPPPEDIPLRATLALSERKSIVERVAATVQRIAVNAVKSVPKWIEIEPHVQFLGPVPVIGFTLKGKGMTLHDFFEAMQGAESSSQ